VGSAADGLEGYEIIRKEEPDLVLLDIKMPPLDGLSMVERLSGAVKRPPEFVAFFRRIVDESVKKDDFAAYAVRRIEERFDTDISAADVAKELGVSESTLGKRFRSVTGYSFVEYATMVRVMKALEILSDPNCRVGEVANRAGISDSRYFSSIFKRETGCTPSEFRKILEGNGIGERH
jgi:YesN/AraC family two-component response regulator